MEATVRNTVTEKEFIREVKRTADQRVRLPCKIWYGSHELLYCAPSIMDKNRKMEQKNKEIEGNGSHFYRTSHTPYIERKVR
jgi:hypothetical protein